MTDFRALNNFVRATGEALKEKVDLAMSSDILRMPFAHYLGEFADDEGFLQATYQAGLQVERMKALEKIREGTRTQKPEDKKKDGQKRDSDKTNKGKETENPRDRRNKPRTEDRNWYGGKQAWATKEDALKGVLKAEKEKYGQSREDCWRCGRSGYKTYECYAFTTKKGTDLPKAPWAVSAASQGKPKHSEEPENLPSKQQKIAAAEMMEVETENAVALSQWWEDSESDF